MCWYSYKAHIGLLKEESEGVGKVQAMSNFKILTLTWNMSGADTSRSTAEWKRSEVGATWIEWIQGSKTSTPGQRPRSGTAEALPSLIQTYDVIAICLQEVHRSSQFAEFFVDELNRALPEAGKSLDQRRAQKYTMSAAKNKSIARFAAQSFDQHLYLLFRLADGFTVAKRGSTCFGAGGTCVKGSVAQHLHRRGEHYIFVNSHFPVVSGEGRHSLTVAERKEAVARRERGETARLAAYHSTQDTLLKKMRTMNNTVIGESKVTIIWAGDFNYRTELAGPSLPQPDELVTGFYRDRLNGVRTIGGGPWPAGTGWRECEGATITDSIIVPKSDDNEDGILKISRTRLGPSYTPTCRMNKVKDVGATGLARQRYTGVMEAYSDKRNPAWCDRVFIKPLDPRKLSCMANKFSSGSVESDHDAIFAEIVLSGVTVGEPAPEMPIEEWHDFFELSEEGSSADEDPVDAMFPRFNSMWIVMLENFSNINRFTALFRPWTMRFLLGAIDLPSSGIKYTAFIPANAARGLDALVKLAEDFDNEISVLRMLENHIAMGAWDRTAFSTSPPTVVPTRRDPRGVFTLQLSTTPSGDMRVTNTLTGASASVISPRAVKVSNGYIYVIDSVLTSSDSSSRSVTREAIGTENSEDTE